MAYSNAIPQASDTKKNSQPAFLENFKCINDLLGVDHVISPWTSPATGDQGKHNQVSFPVQGAAPVFPATENGIYSLIPTASPLTALQEMFIHKQNNAGAVDIPFTASILSTTTPGNLSDGWSYLPSGILLKWGGSTATGAATYTFATGANIPVFTACFSILLTPYDNTAGDVNGAIRLVAVTATTFDVYASSRTASGSGTMGYRFLAIGY